MLATSALLALVVAMPPDALQRARELVSVTSSGAAAAYASELVDVCRADGAAIFRAEEVPEGEHLRPCRGLTLEPADWTALGYSGLDDPELPAGTWRAERRSGALVVGGLATLLSGLASTAVIQAFAPSGRSRAYDVVLLSQAGLGLGLFVTGLIDRALSRPSADRILALRERARARNAETLTRLGLLEAPVAHPGGPSTDGAAARLDWRVPAPKLVLVGEGAAPLQSLQGLRSSFANGVPTIVPTDGGGESAELRTWSGDGRELPFEAVYAAAGATEQGEAAISSAELGTGLLFGGLVVSVGGTVMTMVSAGGDDMNTPLFVSGVVGALVGAAVTVVGSHVIGSEVDRDELEALVAAQNARERRAWLDAAR